MLSVPIAVLEAELKWTFLGEYESCRRISEHGHSGWVVPPDDVAAFTHAMDQLLLQPDLTRRFSNEGPPRAAGFDIARMVESYTELFLEQAAGGQTQALRA